MNEADRKMLELANWLKTSVEQPSNESWAELFRLSKGQNQATARKERNRRYYQKKKNLTVLNSLNGRLKASELSEIVLNGLPHGWVKAGTEAWWRINEDRKAKGLPTCPMDKDGGWYIDKSVLLKLGIIEAPK